MTGAGKALNFILEAGEASQVGCIPDRGLVSPVGYSTGALLGILIRKSKLVRTAIMETFQSDLRYGLRVLIKNPGFFLLAVAVLGLGIGASTAIFNLVNAVLLKPLPVEQPDRLLGVYTKVERAMSPYSSNSYPDYRYYLRHSEVFSYLAAYSRTSIHLGGVGQAEKLEGALCSGNYFSTLGVHAYLGRTLNSHDDGPPGASPVAVISYGLWQRRFGSDPDALGRDVVLNGSGFTIVGVALPGFTGIDEFPVALWVPLSMSDQLRHSSGLLEQRRRRWLEIVGRLKSGYDLEQAQASMDILAAQLAQAHPEIHRDLQLLLFPTSKRNPRFRPTYLSVTWLLAAVVGAVLLIACTNVANLILAQGIGRRKELATRLALGASRLRLIRQLLTEGVLLAMVGGCVGLLLALWFGNIILAMKPAIPIPIEVDLSPDMRLLGFAMLLSLFSVVVFGLLPAVCASRLELAPALKEEARGRDRTFGLLNPRKLLVIFQVGLSVLLLVAAGLFLQSLMGLYTINPGFDPERVVVASIDLGLQGYQEDQGRIFYRQMVERIESLPSVQSVSLAQYVPLSHLYMPVFTTEIALDDREPPPEGEPIRILTNIVGHHYFRSIGIPLRRGRDFNAGDAEGAQPTVIINETMARRYWPAENPIGKRIRIHRESADITVEIVGVASDSKYLTLYEDPAPYMYLPLAQHYTPWVTLQIRSTGDPERLVGEVRREMQLLDSNLPIHHVGTLNDAVSISLFPAKAGAEILSASSIAALLLAVIGLYGILANGVANRKREIGVRMAIGAQTRDVLTLVVKEGLVLVLLGAVGGFACSLALERYLSGYLFEVSGSHPLMLIGVSGILLVTAMLACYLPARRATRINPVSVLRHQ